jgi:hypothetical protein
MVLIVLFGIWLTVNNMVVLVQFVLKKTGGLAITTQMHSDQLFNLFFSVACSSSFMAAGA